MKKKPKIHLDSMDGNAFAILGKARKASILAKWTPEEWEEFRQEAISGDYDHLKAIVKERFDTT